MPGVIQSGQARSEDSFSSSQDLAVDLMNLTRNLNQVRFRESESLPKSVERRAKRNLSGKKTQNKMAKNDE